VSGYSTVRIALRGHGATSLSTKLTASFLLALLALILLCSTRAATALAIPAATPAPVATSEGTEYTYFRGENNAIWQADSLGGIKEVGGTAQGNPATVVLPDGERDVYYTGTEGSIWRLYFNPASQSWSSSKVGGVTAGDPAVTAADPHTVFFRQAEGCGNCIYEAYLSGETWHTAALGGDASGDPSVVANEAGADQVFWPEVVGGSGAGDIAEWYLSGGTWHFARIGGTPTSDKPAIALHADGTESVFFRAREGCGNCIDQLYWNGSSWATEWIGGSSSGPPVTVDEGDSHASFYFRDGEGSNPIYSFYGNPVYPGGSWTALELGGEAAGNPGEVLNPVASASKSIYYVNKAGGLSDFYYSAGSWSSRVVCASPCSAHSPSAPTVTGVSPTAGLTGGGTSVTIKGTNFSEVSGVKFGATNATSYTVNSIGQITATAPAGTGTVDVTVTTPGGTSATSAADHFLYVAEGSAPTVKTLSPTYGPTTGGTSVTITGTGFVGVTSVRFGTEQAASFTVNSSESITAITPESPAGKPNVYVTTPNGTSPESRHFEFEPVVFSVTPNKGPAAGGTSFAITGNGFLAGSEATTIKFGTVKVKTSECTSTTECSGVTPAHVAGSYEVHVKVNGVESLPMPPGDLFVFE
jgi:IPT/TIG domain